MMTRLQSFIVILLLGFMVPGSAWSVPLGGNLLSNGDFESITTADFTQADFDPAAPVYGEWLTQPRNIVVASDGGPTGTGDAFASHLQNTVRLAQAVDASGLTAGTELELSFDFIYQTGFSGISQSAVHVLGLKDTDPKARVFAPFNNPGDVLYSHALTPPYQFDWTNITTSFVLGDTYDSLLVIFTAGAFGNNTEGTRGVDNVELRTTVIPEPMTFLLLGAGLIGLGVRKRLVRK